jgi:hypothetical protein
MLRSEMGGADNLDIAYRLGEHELERLLPACIKLPGADRRAQLRRDFPE